MKERTIGLRTFTIIAEKQQEAVAKSPFSS